MLMMISVVALGNVLRAIAVAAVLLTSSRAVGIGCASSAGSIAKGLALAHGWKDLFLRLPEEATSAALVLVLVCVGGGCSGSADSGWKEGDSRGFWAVGGVCLCLRVCSLRL